RETKLLSNFAHFVVVIPFVQAQSLRLSRRRLGAFGVGWNTLQRFPRQLHVVAIGAVHRHADRNAAGLDQQAAFDTLLRAIGRVFACLFPPRGVLSSGTRPCSAKTNQGLSGLGRPLGPHPTCFETRPRAPILGSGRAPSNPGKTWWHPELSIGS